MTEPADGQSVCMYAFHMYKYFLCNYLPSCMCLFIRLLSIYVCMYICVYEYASVYVRVCASVSVSRVCF